MVALGAPYALVMLTRRVLDDNAELLLEALFELGPSPGAAAGTSSGAADGAIAHVTMLGCWVASTAHWAACLPVASWGAAGASRRAQKRLAKACDA